MNDQLWVTTRYILIGGGSFLAGRGIIPPDQVAQTVDLVMTAGGTFVAAAAALWGLYVRWNTKAVPAVTGARDDVPTINPATGAHQPGKEKP